MYFTSPNTRRSKIMRWKRVSGASLCSQLLIFFLISDPSATVWARPIFARPRTAPTSPAVKITCKVRGGSVEGSAYNGLDILDPDRKSATMQATASIMLEGIRTGADSEDTEEIVKRYNADDGFEIFLAFYAILGLQTDDNRETLQASFKEAFSILKDENETVSYEDATAAAFRFVVDYGKFYVDATATEAQAQDHTHTVATANAKDGINTMTVDAGSSAVALVPLDAVCAQGTCVLNEGLQIDVTDRVTPGVFYSAETAYWKLLSEDERLKWVSKGPSQLTLVWKSDDSVKSFWKGIKHLASVAFLVSESIQDTAKDLNSVSMKKSLLQELSRKLDECVRSGVSFFGMIKVLSNPVGTLANVPGAVGNVFQALDQPIKYVLMSSTATIRRLQFMQNRMNSMMSTLSQATSRATDVSCKCDDTSSILDDLGMACAFLERLNKLELVPSNPGFDYKIVEDDILSRKQSIDCAKMLIRDALFDVDNLLGFKDTVDRLYADLERMRDTLVTISEATDGIYSILDQSGVINAMDSATGVTNFLMKPINHIVDGLLSPIADSVNDVSRKINPFGPFEGSLNRMKDALSSEAVFLMKDATEALIEISQVETLIPFCATVTAPVAEGFLSSTIAFIDIFLNQVKDKDEEDPDLENLISEAMQARTCLIPSLDYMSSCRLRRQQDFVDAFLEGDSSTMHGEAYGLARFGTPSSLQDVDALSVGQGKLNTCWILAPLSAVLSQNPRFAASIIDCIERSGKCKVTFWRGTYKETTVVIDNRLPVRPRAGLELDVGASEKMLNVFLDHIDPQLSKFVSSSDGNLAPFVEKAVAKLAGGFDELEEGYVPVALYMLLGSSAEIQTIYHNSGDRFSESALRTWHEYQCVLKGANRPSEMNKYFDLHRSSVVRTQDSVSLDNLSRQFGDRNAGIFLAGLKNGHTVSIYSFHASGIIFCDPKRPRILQVMDKVDFADKVEFVYKVSPGAAKSKTGWSDPVPMSEALFSKMRCGHHNGISKLQADGRERTLSHRADNIRSSEREDALDIIPDIEPRLTRLGQRAESTLGAAARAASCDGSLGVGGTILAAVTMGSGVTLPLTVGTLAGIAATSVAAFSAKEDHKRKKKQRLAQGGKKVRGDSILGPHRMIMTTEVGGSAMSSPTSTDSDAEVAEGRKFTVSAATFIPAGVGLVASTLRDVGSPRGTKNLLHKRKQKWTEQINLGFGRNESREDEPKQRRGREFRLTLIDIE